MTIGFHCNFAVERIYHGEPFDRALANELERCPARRVVVVTTARQSATRAMAALASVLGPRHAATFAGVTSHVPSACVLNGAAVARAADADLIVAFGGGSVIDAAKAILLCVHRAVSDLAGLDALAGLGGVDPSDWGELPRLRLVALPSTLSAAEQSWFGGVTDPERRLKQGFGAPALMPRAIVYDPALTTDVPLDVFLASGIKAVDHAAERLGAVAGQPFSDALSAKALELLAAALPRVRANPDDLAARSDCQRGAWLSMVGAMDGVGVGASHALGHALGAHTGVGHGFTSCVCLAPVLSWNAGVAGERQQAIADALGAPEASAGGAVAQLVERLGLPCRLRDLGIDRAVLPAVAAKAFTDPPMRTNPRQPAGHEEVAALLEAMW